MINQDKVLYKTSILLEYMFSKKVNLPINLGSREIAEVPVTSYKFTKLQYKIKSAHNLY